MRTPSARSSPWQNRSAMGSTRTAIKRSSRSLAKAAHGQRTSMPISWQICSSLPKEVKLPRPDRFESDHSLTPLSKYQQAECVYLPPFHNTTKPEDDQSILPCVQEWRSVSWTKNHLTLVQQSAA